MSQFYGNRLTTVIWPQSVALSTTVTSIVIDTAGALGCGFELSIGAAGGTVDAKVQRDDNSGFASAADITNAAIAQIAAATANTKVIIEVLKPTERYVRLSVTTGSGGARLISAQGYLFSRYGSISQGSGFSQEIYVQEGV